MFRKRFYNSITFVEIINTVRLFLKDIKDNQYVFENKENPDKEICAYEAILIRVGYEIFMDLLEIISENDYKNQKILGIFDYILDLELDPNEICVESKFRYVKTGTNVSL